jgi:hypothetical protein
MVVNLKSAAFSGCVCPIRISRGGDSSLFPKIDLEGFVLGGCHEYSVDIIVSVHRFEFKKKTRDSNKIKSIRS